MWNGPVLERWAWMSAVDGVIGQCWEIREVTALVALRTGLTRGDAYVLIPNPRAGGDGIVLSGPLEELRPGGIQLLWAIPVADCEDELAMAWRGLWDERVYEYQRARDRSIRSGKFRRTEQARIARDVLEAISRAASPG